MDVGGRRARRGLFTGVALACLGLAPTSAEAAHICWIERVVAERAGVRVFWTGGGAVARGARNGTYARVGAVLRPANSPSDACTITVERRGGKLGVAAKAVFFAPQLMEKPDASTAWIEAEPRPRPRRG